MLTQEEHAALLRSFAVDRLLQLVTLEAKRLHDGHVTIFALTTHYQVAFGLPTSRACDGKARGWLGQKRWVPFSGPFREDEGVDVVERHRHGFGEIATE